MGIKRKTEGPLHRGFYRPSEKFPGDSNGKGPACSVGDLGSIPVSVYSGSLWSSLYCGVSLLCVGLYRWLVKVSWIGKLIRCSGGWSWISSLWSAMNEVSSNEL